MAARAQVAACLVITSALLGCAADPVPLPAGTADPSAGGDRSRSATASSPTATPPPTTTTTPALEPMTLAFVGDVHFEREIRTRLDADPGSVFGPARDLLGRADLTFGNLETAITERGAPEPKAYTFRAPATAFDALELAGFDAVTMANNHGVDYGAEGLADTLAAIGQTDVAVAGIGPDAAAAYAPVFLEAKGRRVAFLGALDFRDETWQNWGATDGSGGVARYDERFLASVRAAESRADLTIAYLHWLPENEVCPDPSIAPPIVDALIEAGADLVIGAHAHILQGVGWRDDVFVSYGLGNYLWYVQRSELTTRTGIFTVTIDADNEPVAYEYAPARIQAPSGIPLPLEGAEAASAQAQLDELRGCTDLAETVAPPG